MECKDCKIEMEEIRDYQSNDGEYSFWENGCPKCGYIAIEQRCNTCEHLEVTWEK